MLATHHHDGLGDGDVETLVVGLLFTVIIAAVVWAIGRGAGRPDLGAIGAAFVGIIGGLLTLLAVL